MQNWPFDVSHIDLRTHFIAWHTVREEYFRDLSLTGRQNYGTGIHYCLHPLVPCRFAQGTRDYGRFALCAIHVPVQNWQWNLQLTVGVQEGIFRASIPAQWVKEILPYEQLSPYFSAISPGKGAAEGVFCAYSPHARISGYEAWLDESALMAQCRAVLASAQAAAISRLTASIYCCYASPSQRAQVYPAVRSAMAELLYSREDLDPGVAALAVDILDQGGVPDWENLSAERGGEALPFERKVLLAWRQAAAPWGRAVLANLTRSSPEQYAVVDRLIQLVRGTAHGMPGLDDGWLPAMVDILTCGQLDNAQAYRVLDLIAQGSPAVIAAALPKLIIRSDSIPSRARNRILPLAQQYGELFRQDLLEIAQSPIRRSAQIARLVLDRETPAGDGYADRP